MELLHGGGAFFEAPRWWQGSWYVSDFFKHDVLRIGADGSVEGVAVVGGQPSGLGWMPDGSLLIVSMNDRRVLRRWPDGSVTEHANLDALISGPANDMVVDALGGAYVSSFGFDYYGGASPRATRIIRVDPDGSARMVGTEVAAPNGMVISEHGSTLIAAETLGARLSAWTISASGDLTDHRIWAQLGPAPVLDAPDTVFGAAFAPDGCALDAEGDVWVADALHGRVCRVAPDGRVVDQRAAPDGLGAYACALGGTDGKTLAICVSSSFLQGPCLAARDAALVAVEVEVPGAGLS
ncbi:MAG: hypothetical protein QOG69_2125 [Actinomycetota bacterium]|jgi:sugar lactone lactonase YvrE|nr:hypothetical protein [Actinomycetota bacterium]